jgi:hypothetical protein
MRLTRILFAAGLLTVISAAPLAAATPATEQAFLTAFKSAYQAKDATALKALIETKGVSPAMLGFYLDALSAGFGDSGATFALQPLTPDDLTDIAQTEPGPDGALVKLTPTPYKKLVISVSSKGATGSSTIYVADEGDKLRIAAPVNVK